MADAWYWSGKPCPKNSRKHIPVADSGLKRYPFISRTSKPNTISTHQSLEVENHSESPINRPVCGCFGQENRRHGRDLYPNPCRGKLSTINGIFVSPVCVPYSASQSIPVQFEARLQCCQQHPASLVPLWVVQPQSCCLTGQLHTSRRHACPDLPEATSPSQNCQDDKPQSGHHSNSSDHVEKSASLERHCNVDRTFASDTHRRARSYYTESADPDASSISSQKRSFFSTSSHQSGRPANATTCQNAPRRQLERPARRYPASETTQDLW